MLYLVSKKQRYTLLFDRNDGVNSPPRINRFKLSGIRNKRSSENRRGRCRGTSWFGLNSHFMESQPGGGSHSGEPKDDLEED